MSAIHRLQALFIYDHVKSPEGQQHTVGPQQPPSTMTEINTGSCGQLDKTAHIGGSSQAQEDYRISLSLTIRAIPHIPPPHHFRHTHPSSSLPYSIYLKCARLGNGFPMEEWGLSVVVLPRQPVAAGRQAGKKEGWKEGWREGRKDGRKDGSADKQATQDCRDTKECLECSGAGGVLIEAMCFRYCSSARFYGYKVSCYSTRERKRS